MDKRKDDHVFEAKSVPRRRQAAQQRITIKCCLPVTASLGSIVGVYILVLAGKALHSFINGLQWPHVGLVQQTPQNYLAIATVRPLVNSSASFDNLAHRLARRVPALEREPANLAGHSGAQVHSAECCRKKRSSHL